MISPYTNYITNIPIELNNNMTGDNCSFNVLPDNTKVWFQPINMKGDFIKKDNSLGSEIIGPAKIIDQRVGRNNILYAVEMLDDLHKIYSTRADLIHPNDPNLKKEEGKNDDFLGKFINTLEKDPGQIFKEVPNDIDSQISALKKFKEGKMSYSEMRMHCG